ncbi:MAG: TonB-dependent receptor plug domain-containing protein, partial [Phycisphaerae bacterium]|nr:TonB-dependent receptor plug domain-containing protein [Gemmatimonadaceae bacterium]
MVGAILYSAAGSFAPCAASAQQVQVGARVRREISGAIVDSATRVPLANVRIAVRGTDIVARTDQNGRYRIGGFLPTDIVLDVREIGFAAVEQRITFTGAIARSDIELAKRVVQLDAFQVRDDSTARFLASQQATAAMSSEDVRQKRGQTLGETLKELPGVSVIQYGPSIAKPVVRGLSSQRIATVNGGVLQEGQQWGAEHAPEIDAFAANEIEVIRGPGTLLYGSGAIGGVVRV